MVKPKSEIPVGQSHRNRATMVLIGMLALIAVIPASAVAATTRNPVAFSPITGEATGTHLKEAAAVAVDEATGNVFVTDGGPGHERIAILGAEGGAPAGLAAPYEISGLSIGANTPQGLAYDNSPTSSRGTLYFYDRSLRAVKKFKRQASTERYEPDGELSITGGFESGYLTVDEEGNLYVATSNNSNKSIIFEFTSAGALLHEYKVNLGENNGIGQVAPDTAGNLFVATGLGLYKFPASAGGGIDPGNFSQVSSGEGTGLAVDRQDDRVLFGQRKRVTELDGSTGEVVGHFGDEVLGLSQGVAFNSQTDRAYATDGEASIGGHENVSVFGSPVVVPTLAVQAASEVTGTTATLNGSINPGGIPVTECIFEWGKDVGGVPNYEHQQPCVPTPPSDGDLHQVSAAISGLVSNGTVYHFRLVAKNGNGKEVSADETFETAPTAVTEAPSEITPEAATLNGVVRPEGLQVLSCKFEYGLTTSANFEGTTPCVPAAASIPADFAPHAVSATITGLLPNAKYRYRLVATSSAGIFEGEVLTFRATGAPLISEVRARDADQSSATVEGAIDTRGFATSYLFEWGPTAAYGSTAGAASVGQGGGIARAVTTLSGLQPGSSYHYRVVATNGEGRISASPDHVVETLNSCGLPDQRCFELTSPPDAGPVGLPGAPAYNLELAAQAGTQPGALAYVVESGLPGATRGAEVLYRSIRGTDGWHTSQISPGISARDESAGPSSETSRTLALSPEVSCGEVESTQLLTPDPSTKAAVEAGGKNLYRLNPDGSYTAISSPTPVNFEYDATESEGFYFEVDGASSNCEKVVFTSFYQYPGVGGVPIASGPIKGSYAYEWDNGVLRNLGLVPGPGGEVAVAALPGGKSTKQLVPIRSNVVSENGSRVFFTAERQKSANPQEVGKLGVFVREDGTITRDLSLSETATADNGATLQAATPDGSRVYFTANAGLTAESSSEGTDLYEYNLETEALTDLSIEQGPGGAAVASVLGVSANGSHIYFAARAQLLPGQGNSRAENLQDSTFSLYVNAEGTIGFVGTITNQDLRYNSLEAQESLTAQVSPNGNYLLFESSAEVTGYDSSGTPEAYLFDSSSTSEAVICVSCRQDGLPPAGQGFGTRILTKPYDSNPRTPVNAPRSLVMRGGLPQVYFTSPDPLAPGAPAGTFSIFEWSHGQVFRVTTESPGQQSQIPEPKVKFLGASSDGSDLYFQTSSPLTWEDGDQRASVYDARVGGGFPAPPPSSQPCNPVTEGSCSGPGAQSPAIPGAASRSFTGPENKKPKHHHKKQQKKKKKNAKKHKHKHGKHKHKDGKKKTKSANGNRRTSK